MSPGVPLLLKDLLAEVRGTPLTMGSALLRGHICARGSAIVGSLRAAGLRPIGRTSVPEFGFLPVTEPRLHGPCRNPWDLERTPGGSSGGAAAAVAAGIVPFAHGSDAGGSDEYRHRAAKTTWRTSMDPRRSHQGTN